MLKKIIKYLIIVFISVYIFSCENNKVNKDQIILKLDNEASTVHSDEFIINKIEINYDDSINIIKYYNSHRSLINVFLKINKSFFELHEYGYIIENKDGNHTDKTIIKRDTILTFSHIDTSFTINNSFDDFFPALVWQLGSYDCKYIIKTHNGYYTTTKQSTIDTSYKEIFFYDKNFHIFKFINTYKNNFYVYVCSSPEVVK